METEFNEMDSADGKELEAVPGWDVNDLLSRWGRWARGGANLDIKPLAMLGGAEACGLPSMDDETAFLFERGLAMLRQYDLMAFKVVRLHYAYGLSLRAIAKINNCSHGTIWQRLQAGQIWFDGFLSGLYKAKNL